jgi:hypothetical protein
VCRHGRGHVSPVPLFACIALWSSSHEHEGHVGGLLVAANLAASGRTAGQRRCWPWSAQLGPILALGLATAFWAWWAERERRPGLKGEMFSFFENAK